MADVRTMGSMQTVFNDKLVTPVDHVYEGRRVVVHLGDRRVVEGTVSCAAGYHCRVRCDDGVERWTHIDDCAVKKSDPT